MRKKKTRKRHKKKHNDKPKVSQGGSSEKKDITYDFAVGEISNIFTKYSIRDVATALFISSTWLPNIASPIKHLLLTSIFASIKPESFSCIDKIRSYKEAKAFFSEIYELLPFFLTIEDYVPEADWGDIKFYHDHQNYKIFFGSELASPYDQLILFQMVCCLFDEQFLKACRRSPVEELRDCLDLQDEIISGISTQPSVEGLGNVVPGYTEIPSSEFWRDAKNFYKKFLCNKRFSKSFLDNYSTPLGSLSSDTLKDKAFHNLAFSGTTLPFFFISHKGQYYPILPRRYSSVLLGSWSEIYGAEHEAVIENGMKCSLSIGAELHKYINARLNSTSIMPLVSAVTDGAPHDVLFSTALISKSRLVLVYVANHLLDPKETEKELLEITPKLEEALRLISKPPMTVALHLARVTAQCQRNEEDQALQPMLFIIIPHIPTSHMMLTFKKSMPGKVVFLDEFLAVIDELEDINMLGSFLEYLDEYLMRINTPFVSLLDMFASYKGTHGVLEEGALSYDNIMLDPHWGSRMRYETLSKFWGLYPAVHHFDHPRSWRLEQETPSRTRLSARGYFGSALYCKIKATSFFITTPFKDMSLEQAEFANFLMECLEYNISRYKKILKEHDAFKLMKHINVIFIPSSLILENEQFDDLRKLIPQEHFWHSDQGFLDEEVYGIRIIYNEEKLRNAFVSIEDSSLEIGLLLEALNKINNFTPDKKILFIKDALEKCKVAKPRFKMREEELLAAFPRLIGSCEPAQNHFKKAKKTIACLAKQIGLTEGYYELGVAKIKLNGLRDAIVREIDSEVCSYNIGNVMPYILTRIDALNDEFEMARSTINYSKAHEVDYNRESRLAERHAKFIGMHQNYRYLIEKFVQHEPHGDEKFEKEQFQQLIALIDWLRIFYSSSDSLHYGINPVGIRVNDNFLVEVVDQEDLGSKAKMYAKEEKALELGLIGNTEDGDAIEALTDKFFIDLDGAFKQELGFTFRTFIEILQMLTFWSDCEDGTDLAPYYSARLSTIEDTCLKHNEAIERDEVALVLDFLTLKKQDVVRVLEQDEPCLDLPVWEHKKRYARYNLRPLCLMKKKFFWGPYSTMKTRITWLSALTNGRLPVDLKKIAIQKVVESRKKQLEKSLEKKALEIVRRYTDYARSNVKLHRVDKDGRHPISLGDYDVLAFCPAKNIILNIECKDLLQVYCLKDAKTLREAIFGEGDGDEGYLGQLMKRNSYLAEHSEKIAQALEWPVTPGRPPEIIPIYLSRVSYWWTRFPPKKVSAIFLRIEMFAAFLDKLLKV